mgnify:FL=1
MRLYHKKFRCATGCTIYGVYMKDRIGQGIKSRRIALGMSLRKLGEKAGVPYRSICLWENGSGDIGAESLVKISSTLETTPNDLLGFERETINER